MITFVAFRWKLEHRSVGVSVLILAPIWDRDKLFFSFSLKLSLESCRFVIMKRPLDERTGL
jgi:hypothetical protein